MVEYFQKVKKIITAHLTTKLGAAPTGTIPTTTMLVVSPLPPLLPPSWWWAHHFCCGSDCGGGHAAPAAAVVVVVLGFPLPLPLPTWWWARWRLHGDSGDGPNAKCWGNITRWSIGIGPNVCAISNMTHYSHLISSVFEQVMSRRWGTGVRAEWQMSRHAAGA